MCYWPIMWRWLWRRAVRQKEFIELTNVFVFRRPNQRPTIFFRSHQTDFEWARIQPNSLFRTPSFAHTHTFNYITSFAPKNIQSWYFAHSWWSWYCWAFYTCKKPFEMVHSNILLLHFKCLFSLFGAYVHVLVLVLMYIRIRAHISYDTLCQFEYFIHCSSVAWVCGVRFAHPHTQMSATIFSRFRMCWLAGCLLVSICHLSKWKIRPK